MIAISTSERNGKVIGAVLVQPEDEVMLISTGGVMIRTLVDQVRETSRSAQGVTLINLDDGTKLAGIDKVIETEEE
jgi:DNA gyrase subunit A